MTMFYFKDSGSVLMCTACAFGVGIATVTVLLCGRFVVLSRKNCFPVQSPGPPYLLKLSTFVGHGGLRASLSAFCDISFLTCLLIPSPLNTRVHT